MNVKVKFVHGNSQIEIDATEGQTILDVVRANDIDLECACEGSLACSTCHVIVDKDFYDATVATTPISDEENDMLDLASGLTKTSRLGCQLKICKELDGMTLTIPGENRNSSPADLAKKKEA